MPAGGLGGWPADWSSPQGAGTAFDLTLAGGSIGAFGFAGWAAVILRIGEKE